MEEGNPVIRRHAPLLGEHSQEILRELGKSDVEITSLEAQGIILVHKGK